MRTVMLQNKIVGCSDRVRRGGIRELRRARLKWACKQRQLCPAQVLLIPSDNLIEIHVGKRRTSSGDSLLENLAMKPWSKLYPAELKVSRLHLEVLRTGDPDTWFRLVRHGIPHGDTRTRYNLADFIFTWNHTVRVVEHSPGSTPDQSGEETPLNLDELCQCVQAAGEIIVRVFGDPLNVDGLWHDGVVYSTQPRTRRMRRAVL